MSSLVPARTDSVLYFLLLDITSFAVLCRSRQSSAASSSGATWGNGPCWSRRSPWFWLCRRVSAWGRRALWSTWPAAAETSSAASSPNTARTRASAERYAADVSRSLCKKWDPTGQTPDGEADVWNTNITRLYLSAHNRVFHCHVKVTKKKVVIGVQESC